MDFTNYTLWSVDELIEKIDIEQVKEYIKNESTFWNSNDDSKMAKEWLNWCKRQSQNVKVIEYDIPGFVSPPKHNICLYDVKVSIFDSCFILFSPRLCNSNPQFLPNYYETQSKYIRNAH